MAALTARLNAGVRSDVWPYIVIITGVSFGSLGPLFIRAGHIAGMPTIAIVAARQVLSCLVLTPIVLCYHRNELTQLSRRNLLFATLAGTVLAVRFYFQFEAYNNSSVLLTSVFGGSGPLWVALTEVLLLRAIFSRRIWAGIFLSLAGGILIAIVGFDGGTSPGNNAILGAALALTAAFLSAFYLNFGRLARGQISFLPYLWLIFTIAAVISVSVALLADVPLTGYSPDAWLALLGLIITAQIFGHGSMNYALKYVPATYVSVISQATSVIGAIAAFFILGEKPGVGQVIGSLIIIIGVTMVTTGRGNHRSA